MILKKLRALRKSKGISQEQMASILSTVPSNYSRKERGEVKIYEEEWKKIADVLEVPLDSFKARSLHVLDSETITSEVAYLYVPIDLLEIQKKYIQKLEEELEGLKKQQQK